ncbi:MAG: DUF6062 family protein [Christensenellales bacterium]
MSLRYHIDTVPVWDALHQDTECPLCLLRRKTEHLLADRCLGASVMAPDTRIQVNLKGFCPTHQGMLYERQNRLGHALMMLSRLKEIRENIDRLPPGAAAPAPALFRRTGGRPDDETARALAQMTGSCLLCEERDLTMDRYARTLLHLWKTDKAFQEAFSRSRGLCIPDAELILRLAPELLSGKARQDLRGTVDRLMRESLQRLYEELEWFTLKFDYRNQDKPWGNSRDALERTITKLRGWCVGSDPGRE